MSASLNQAPLPVWTAVDDYINAHYVQPDQILDSVLISAAEGGLPPHSVAPNQGKLLQILIQISKSARILEIGTLAGYSTIWMARAVEHLPGGRVISLEVNAHNAQIAKANIELASLSQVVTIMVAPALDSLDQLIQNKEQFDFIFIDADKPNNPNYLQRVLKLSHAGTVIVADNIVRDGKVTDAASTDPNVIGVRAFNDALSKISYVNSTQVQTVGSKGWDGFGLSLITADPPK